MILLVARRRFIVAVCAVCLSALPVYAKRGNVAQAVNGSIASGGANCTICHFGGAGSGSVQILGAPSAYVLGGVYDLTVRVSDPVQAGAGFQLSVEDAGGAHVGTLAVVDATNTKFNDTDPNWVNHTATGVANSVANWAANGQSADFSVQWQAPLTDVGTVTFFAAGNAINDNNSLTGDNVYTTSESASLATVPAVSDWGLASLLVCLMITGTLVLRRHESGLA